MANVTSSGNTTIKPTISAAKFMGASHAAGSTLENQIANINLSLSTLALKIKKNFESINLLAETIQNASLHSHTDNDDSNGDNKDNISNGDNSKLDEINSILLDIGNAMSLDFANRITEGKEEVKGIQAQKSRGKFGRAEGRLEGSGKKIGSIFKSTGSKAASPVQGIFGKIMSFLGLLGTGIAANAGFEWLKDDKNKKKLSTFFKIIQKNWKWVVGAAGILIGADILIKAFGILTTLGAVLTILTNPFVLAALAILSGSGWSEQRKKKTRQSFNETNDGSILTVKEFQEDNKNITNPNEKKIKGSWWKRFLQGILELGSTPGAMSYHNGGIVTGPTNEVPAILERGELVIPKQVVATLSQNPKKSGLNITTINMPGITEGSIPQGSSTVATAVPNIAATNFSDPYRRLTPKIYGIYV